MSFLVKTIENDDEIKVDSEDSSDSDEELTLASKKQRTQKKLESKGFNPEFQFDDEGFYESKWTLESALHNAIKQKKMHSTLDQKIEQVRQKRIAAKKVVQISSNIDNVKVDIDEEEKSLDDDDIIGEDEVVKGDRIRPKLARKRNKYVAPEQSDDDNDDVNMLPLAEVKDSIAGNKSATWDPNLSFQDMNLSRPLLKAVSEMSYVTPTPIQQAAIPVGLLGRDICACAATGTGKTAAFMLPVLERLFYRPQSSPAIRVLCLVPTRELAVQVYSVTHQLAEHSSVRICLAAGGLDIKSQEASLRQSPDIVIATPGRLIDHLHNTPSFSLSLIEILILDEADRMLDEYFEEQMKEIIKLCSPQRQTLLFSATMSDQVQELAAVSLKSPVKIFVNSNTDVAPFLRQEFVRIRTNREGDREAIVAALCTRSFITNVLMFTQTKKQAHRMHIVLGLIGLKAGELHGNLSQGQRLESLKRFKNGDVDILVCTDLAARGLDIENVKTVINFTMPNSQQHYVHRVGRTARAGRSGRSVSLVGESERKLLKEIVKFSKNPVKNRVIPTDVISKFAQKLKEIEREVGEVLKLEAHEKEIVASENQVKKAEKIMKGDVPEKRQWFQTKIQRELIKAERMLGNHSELNGRRSKKIKKAPIPRPQNAEERVKLELEKTNQYQHRIEKRKRKEKRARACAEDPVQVKKQKTQKSKSSFDVEIKNSKKPNKFKGKKLMKKRQR